MLERSSNVNRKKKVFRTNFTAKNKGEKYKLVRVEWEDSVQPVSEWQWADAYETPETFPCVSVGFLIAKTKRAVAIAPNLGDTENLKCQASGVIRIPVSSIRKITFL